jgi:hypothetical protein
MHGDSVSKYSRIEEGPVLIGNLRLHSRQTEFPQGVLVLFCFLFVVKLLTKFFRWMVPIILGQNGIRCRNGPECRGVCGSISELCCNNLIYILQVDVLTAAKGTGHILDILYSLPTLFFRTGKEPNCVLVWIWCYSFATSLMFSYFLYFTISRIICCIHCF